MSESDTHDGSDRPPTETDGGLSDVEREEQIDYLDVKINLLDPATPFMRDHQRVIWAGFIAWAVAVFGPITLTRIAPDLMTTQMPVIGFPLHYFLIAIGGPTAALLLSVWYARKRDQIDKKYGIEQVVAQEPSEETVAEEPATADGGVSE